MSQSASRLSERHLVSAPIGPRGGRGSLRGAGGSLRGARGSLRGAGGRTLTWGRKEMGGRSSFCKGQPSDLYRKRKLPASDPVRSGHFPVLFTNWRILTPPLLGRESSLSTR